jgi:hypothetical protein
MGTHKSHATNESYGTPIALPRRIIQPANRLNMDRFAESGADGFVHCFAEGRVSVNSSLNFFVRCLQLHSESEFGD